jgi:hypothetical protein
MQQRFSKFWLLRTRKSKLVPKLYTSYKKSLPKLYPLYVLNKIKIDMGITPIKFTHTPSKEQLIYNKCKVRWVG